MLQYLKNKFGSDNGRKLSTEPLRKMDEDDVGPVPLPNNAERLLSLFLTKADRSVILDDLEEEFRTEILPRLGAERARRWYWRQATLTLLYRNPLILWLLTSGKFNARATEEQLVRARIRIARLEHEYSALRAELVAGAGDNQFLLSLIPPELPDEPSRF